MNTDRNFDEIIYQNMIYDNLVWLNFADAATDSGNVTYVPKSTSCNMKGCLDQVLKSAFKKGGISCR